MKEKHYRSVLKGITWRIIGTADTIFLSWLFTGNISSALKIGGFELFTKITLFYLHERAWIYFGWGKMSSVVNGIVITKDKHWRSLVKGMSWRVFGTLDTMVIAFFVTGDYSKAMSIGFTEVFTKVILYYFHERAWLRWKFGVKKIPAESGPAFGKQSRQQVLSKQD